MTERSLVEVLHEDIIPRLSVEDVYRDVPFVARRGRYWRAGCPLHGGRDPNFSVDTETLAYHCFSQCGTGSALTFLNDGEVPRGQRFVELVRDLAGRAGVVIPERRLTPEEAARVERNRRRLELLEAFAAAAAAELERSTGARDYLVARGISAEPADLARVGLGITPDLTRVAEATRAGDAELRALGLGAPGWPGRLTIVWRDRWGRIASIAARAMPGHETGPKYLYLRDAPRPPFFGVDRLRRGRPASRLVVVEGMLDVIQLELGGMPGVVALGSASISERHLLALEELGIASVVLALDADPAGLIGTDAFIELARERSPQLRVTVIPAAALRGLKDPGELVAAHGTQAIRDAIDARVPAAVFQAQQIVGSLGPEAAVAARRDALAALTGLAERLEGPDRDADLEDLASLGVRHLGYSEEVVRSHLGLPSGITLTAATSVREVPSPYGLVEAPDADDRPSAIPYPPNLIRILGGPMYSAEISRRNPTALVFLLDQSGSMAEDFAGTGGQTKSAFLATVINRQLQELVLRCTKDDGIRDYFHVAVLGYGSDVYPALSGGKVALIPVSEVGASPLRIEQRTQMVPDGVGGLVEQTVRFPVWVDPVANGATSMSEALRTAQDLLAEWIEQHPDAFPPTIINVTDGASTDGDPTGPAQDLRSLATRDGSVFLFNIHTSGRPGPEAEYLETDASLADPLAKQLFSMSSQLPDHMVEAVSAADAPVRRGARGFLFNANPTSLTRFLSIGTRPANDLR